MIKYEHACGIVIVIVVTVVRGDMNSLLYSQANTMSL